MVYLGTDGMFEELQGAPQLSDSCEGLHRPDHTSHSPEEGVGVAQLKSKGSCLVTGNTSMTVYKNDPCYWSEMQPMDQMSSP